MVRVHVERSSQWNHSLLLESPFPVVRCTTSCSMRASLISTIIPQRVNACPGEPSPVILYRGSFESRSPFGFISPFSFCCLGVDYEGALKRCEGIPAVDVSKVIHENDGVLPLNESSVLSFLASSILFWPSTMIPQLQITQRSTLEPSPTDEDRPVQIKPLNKLGCYAKTFQQLNMLMASSTCPIPFPSS